MDILGCLVLMCAIFHIPAEAQYNYEEVLEKSILFYEAQRSGDLPPSNRIPWRGDSSLDDRGNGGEDLSGGWHDAGDNVKFGFTMASSVTVLAWGVVEYRAAYEASGQLDYALDSIRWPLDYFIKCHISDNEFYGQVADGDVDHQYWGRPEEMTMPRPAFMVNASSPGSDLAAETAAAMAASSIAFRSTDSAYADILLAHAQTLYDFAYNNRGKYSDSITDADGFYPSTAYEDELCWGALWLYRATDNPSYLTQAEEFYPWYHGWAFSWDDKEPGINVLYYMLTGARSSYVEDFLNDWLPGGSVTYTPLGLAWRDTWGSLRYSANAAFVALVAADAGIMTSEARQFAQDQIHYMLGDTGRSFVVGYGVNPPLQPHHAAASCELPPAPCDWDDFSKPEDNPQVLSGALVGGPDANDNYVDEREDYISNEVTCDYNAGFQSAIAGLIGLGLNK